MDVEARIFDKLDKIEENLSDLCDRMTRQETEFEAHIERMERSHDRKLKNRDFMIIVFGSIIGLIELINVLGII